MRNYIDSTAAEKVTLPLKDYNELLNKTRTFEAFMTALYNSAKLDYTGNDLKFDSDIVGAFIHCFDPIDYKERLHHLQKIQEMEFAAKTQGKGE